jgi:DNA-binding transcriptional ArsR family regulator
MASDTVEASVLKALCHPLRMRLLTFVAERGEASPVEMSRALDVPLATVSHHTRVLRDLRYIELSRTEQRRGAVEHYYFDAAGAHIARRTLDLDVQGWRELSRAVSTLLRRAEAIQARSDARRDGKPIEDETAGPSELAILHFAVAEPAGSHEAEPKRRTRASRLP